MDMLKGATKSKTMWFSSILVALGFLEQNSGLLSAVVGPEHMGVAVAAVGGVNMVLRALTTDALADK